MAWYRIAASRDVKRNKIFCTDRVNQRLIAFRDQSGAVKVASAFCPHLGAHLGVGGRIVRGEIVCPFHAWRFDSSGQCVGIPYCDKIPKKAVLNMFPSIKIAGQVFAHFGATPQPFDERIFQDKKCIERGSVVIKADPSRAPIALEGDNQLTTYTPLMNGEAEAKTFTLVPRRRRWFSLF